MNEKWIVTYYSDDGWEVIEFLTYEGAKEFYDKDKEYNMHLAKVIEE